MTRERVSEVLVVMDDVIYRGTWRLDADGRLIVTHARKEASVLLQEGNVQEQAAALLVEIVGRQQR